MNLHDPSTLFLILLALSAAFLLFRTRGSTRPSKSQSAATTSALPAGGDPRDALPPAGLPPDLAQWEVEMHETARRLSAQLDAKMGLLQALVVEADRAAARLEEALDRGHCVLPPGSQAESLRPSAEHARDLVQDAEPPTAEIDSARTSDRPRRREEIYRLADYGFAPAEIARRVGVPVGEVELILSLRGKQSS